MDTISTLIIVLCGYTGAMILTTYKKSSPVRVSGLVSCGVNVIPFDFCAARVTNNTCDPLDRDWCETKDTSDEGVFIIKQNITEILKDTLVSGYNRPIPIYLSEGSELEFKFKLHSGWIKYGSDLMDDSGNIVLHTMIRSPADFYWGAYINGNWLSTEGHFGTFSVIDDTIYTLKIVCATSGFQIYLNGALEWTYLYQLPADTIRFVDSYFTGAQGDLYQVTYKAGP